MDELLILVDESDHQKGVAGKKEVHEKGLLHRAVSVFIFNNQKELLLQRRAKAKYHSAGLWSNTCCGHPLPGESAIASANRRLLFEMGMNVELKFINTFLYKANLVNGLIEHELDHVFYGITDDPPHLNYQEADEWKYISSAVLKSELKNNARFYTPWLKICIDEKILRDLI